MKQHIDPLNTMESGKMETSRRKDTDTEYGEVVECTKDISLSGIKAIVTEILLPRARETLGPGVVVEIRRPLPPYKPGVAWYTTAKIMTKGVTGLVEPFVNEHGHYIDCGRVVT